MNLFLVLRNADRDTVKPVKKLRRDSELEFLANYNVLYLRMVSRALRAESS